MKKVVLYPFNKISRGLVRFRDLLDFEIVGVVDFLFNIGEDAGENSDGKPSNILVMDNLEKAFDGADTLIVNDCGFPMPHFQELFEKNNMLEKWKNLILKAKEKGLKIVSTHEPSIFDESLQQWINENEVEILTYTKTREEFLSDIEETKKIKRTDKIKVVPIFATRPCIGKFTTEMSLFRELKNSGSGVTALITEPTNFLFKQPSGDEIVINKIAQTPMEAMDYFESIIIKAENKGDDFVLVADQSSVIDDYHIFIILWHTVLLKSFSNGYPLLIVGYDDDQRIRDCIDLIRIYGKSNPVALLIPDKIELEYGKYEIKTKEQIEKRKIDLKEKFEIKNVELISDIKNIKDLLINLD